MIYISFYLFHLTFIDLSIFIELGTKEEMKGRGEEIKNTAFDSVRSMKSLVLMLIDSYEFRALAVDFIGWLQDIAKSEWRQAEHQPPRLSKEEEKMQALQGKPLREQVKEKGQQAKEFAAEVVNDIAEGNLPIDEYRKEELQRRLDDLIRRFANDERFQRALNGVFEIFQLAYQMAGRVGEEAKEKGQEIYSNVPVKSEGLRKMWEDGRGLLEQFTGKDEMDKFIGT